MGAISSRYWMEHLGGAAHVDAWVSLAGVNEGTVWAYGCYVLDAVSRDGADVVGARRSRQPRPRDAAPTRYGAWWSPCDDAIIPRTNAELPGAHNVETSCLDHTEMRTDPQVLDQVVQFLQGVRPVHPEWPDRQCDGGHGVVPPARQHHPRAGLEGIERTGGTCESHATRPLRDHDVCVNRVARVA